MRIKLLIIFLLLAAPTVSFAQVFGQNQLIVSPLGSNGFVVSTTTANGAKLSATSTPFFSLYSFTNASGTVMSLGTLCLDTCRITWPNSGGDPFTHPSTNVSATTSGIIISASSTIGNGLQNGGLTVSGGSTTTLNAYFQSPVGINGVSNRGLFGGNGILTVNGDASNGGVFEFFRPISSSQSNVFTFTFGDTSNSVLGQINGRTDTSGSTGMIRFLTSNGSADLERLRVDSQGQTMVGTTSAFAPFTVASSGPQISLVDGSNTSNAWTIRSIANSFFIATSTNATSATSSVAAMQITPNSQIVFPALQNCNTIDTDANGLLSCGVDAGSWPFTTSASYNNQVTQSTSTLLWLRGSPLSLAASSSVITYASSTVLSTGTLCMSDTCRSSTMGLQLVAFIMLENLSYDNTDGSTRFLIGSSTFAKINALRVKYGSATKAYGVQHASLGNYLAFASGAGNIYQANVKDDTLDPSVAPLSGQTLVELLASSSIPWKHYAEGLPSTGYLGADSGSYVQHHNPWVYYSSVRNQSSLYNNIVNYTQLATDLNANTAPPIMFIQPTNADNCHDFPTATCDNFVDSLVTTLQASTWYQQYNGTIILWFDEGDDTATQANMGIGDAAPANNAGGGHVPFVVIKENVRTIAYNGPVNIYGQLLYLEDLYGLNLLASSSHNINGQPSALFNPVTGGISQPTAIGQVAFYDSTSTSIAATSSIMIASSGIVTFPKGFLSQASSTVAGIFNASYASTTALTASGQIFAPMDSTTNPNITAGSGTTATSDYTIGIEGGRAMIGYTAVDAAGNGALVLNGGSSKGINMYVGGTSNSFQTGTQALTITPAGFVGISSSSPNTLLTVSGNVTIDGGSASKIFMGDQQHVFEGDRNGDFVATNSAGSYRLNTSGGGAVFLNDNGGAKFQMGGSLETLGSSWIDDSGRFSIGTSTPNTNARMTLALDTGPQLSLIDTSSNNFAWTIRSIAGSMYFATSTQSATSSKFSLQLGKNGDIYAPNTSSSGGAQTGYWCYDTSGQLIRDTVVCIAVSARRFKENIQPLTVGLDELLKLQPVSYKLKDNYNILFKDNPNYNGTQYSLVADDVQKVDPHLVTVETSPTTFEGTSYPVGTVHGLADKENWIALFTKSIQDLNAKVDGMKGVARSTEENWQWMVMVLLFGFIALQQDQIRRLKK